MPKRLLILVCALLFVFSSFKPAEAVGDLENGAAMVLELMDLMHQYHISNPDVSVLTNGAIQGLLDSLEDPYADYFSDEELRQFTDAINGDLMGVVGIEVMAGEGYPLVVGVIPGTPAARGGVKAGDIIVAIDGQDISGWPLVDVVEKIRGPSGTKVVLKLHRGDVTLDIELSRADVHVPSVQYEMLAGKTGYISVASFGSSTGREFDDAVRRLQGQGMESLIIDLRNNGGGFVLEAVDILDNFLAENTLVASIVDGKGNREDIRSQKKPVITSLPMVVIVNDLSASAAEILAGALQDYKMATLVGNVTFGKGVVQTIIPLSSGGALKMTVSKYLTPAGNDIDKVGLTPDHYVFTNELQREVAWQILHPGDILRLTVEPGTGRAALNGRVLDLAINVEKRGSIYLLPLRPVLEALLYQVFWQDGVIKVLSDQGEVLSINLNGDGIDSRNEIILKGGVSYLTENILKQLNIDIIKDENKIALTRLK
ncbi:S41 family peptidase [Desulfallas thermosapovorans]|uniref:Carboxyl-terminal processing protease n=1 Tax=Desulfallas thermosapovorans DSM 6562 TaxID=1121431 RepID=A0A5S4ZNU7_9FIRM|nr:S41 family peptidase [Desulfallas thermosapovorans]TYO94506.1 carboxyl-terminal processing protease [Desulfallas thermosapovorans DSM 6562]